MSKTAHTLIEAITNGKRDWLENIDEKAKLYNEPFIEKHVEDYLAQHFGALMLAKPEMADDLEKLFKRIVRRS